MSDKQWTEVTTSEFKWERSALMFLRENLPEWNPFRAWSNFEFIALDGSIFEVDLLIFSKAGIFLVEIKSHRGHMVVGPRTWVQTRQNGAINAFDNPRYLANKKAKLLKSVLQREYHNAKVPFIESLIFLSDPDLTVEFKDRGDANIFFHPDNVCRPNNRSLPSILDALIEGKGPGVRRAHYDLNKEALKRFRQALDSAGIDRSSKFRRYGDYELTELLDAGEHRQDWLAIHRSNKSVRRARVFFSPKNITDEQLSRMQEAARREFEILDSLRHESILDVKQHVNYEQRPGLLFEAPEGALRLDHYLDANQVDFPAKLNILLKVSEAIQYAHRKRVVHRALSPQSVLVVPEGDTIGVRVFNWHTSRRENVETGTMHLQDYLDDVERSYLAPELTNDPVAGEHADIYGLGALAYGLFTEQPPADTVEGLLDILMRQQGLRLSTVLDNVSPRLDDLIYAATRPNPKERISTVEGFVDRLLSLKREVVIRRPAIDPLDAQEGDVLDDRFRVIRRIGSGSSATALLAETLDGEVVLKVANDLSRNELIEAEAKDLQKLSHPLIVDLYDCIDLNGRSTLVLQSAGITLRDRLRDRVLSLDEVRRFGEDLCDILVALEQQRVFHRDLKPANLGIGTPGGEKTRQRLMLFDFSLAGISLNSTDVGTPVYRDPFIRDPKRRRWDEYADRYSGAVSLHEMVTGHTPSWGDDRSDPLFDREAKLHLQTERFPASVRDGLSAFFEKALAREVGDRFDHAEDMRRAWQSVFETTLQTVHNELELRLHKVDPTVRISDLGISALARDALDRLNILTLDDLLEIEGRLIQFLKGASTDVRNELQELRRVALEVFPQENPEIPSNVELNKMSVDQILDRIEGKATADFVQAILARDSIVAALPWPTRDQLAERASQTIKEFEKNFDALGLAWSKKKALGALRDDIARLAENADGAMSDLELARSVLGLRGCLLKEPKARLEAAAAVSRAAVEAELSSENPRVRVVRIDNGVFVVSRPELGDLLYSLGQRTDALVDEGVIGEQRAVQELSKILQSAGVSPIAYHRLLALSTAASAFGELSSRNELYKFNLASVDALKLSAGVIAGSKEISPDEVRERVEARYPKAERLPEHPELDSMLKEAGLVFEWDSSCREGRGAYINNLTFGTSLTRSTIATSFSSGTMLPLDALREVKTLFEERIETKVAQGGFLALLCDPRNYQSTVAALSSKHGLEIISIDRVFLRILREKAKKFGIEWSVVTEADAPQAEDDDKRHLHHLVREVLADVRTDLAHRQGKYLFTDLGILAHFEDAGAMDLIAELHGIAGTDQGPRLAVLLIAADQRHSSPHIDGAVVPVLHQTEYARIPR